MIRLGRQRALATCDQLNPHNSRNKSGRQKSIPLTIVINSTITPPKKYEALLSNKISCTRPKLGPHIGSAAFCPMVRVRRCGSRLWGEFTRYAEFESEGYRFWSTKATAFVVVFYLQSVPPREDQSCWFVQRSSSVIVAQLESICFNARYKGRHIKITMDREVKKKQFSYVHTE